MNTTRMNDCGNQDDIHMQTEKRDMKVQGTAKGGAEKQRGVNPETSERKTGKQRVIRNCILILIVIIMLLVVVPM